MSTVRACDLDDVNLSENCLENEAPVQVKIKQAQDIIKQMNEKLSFTFLNFEKIAYDRNRERLAKLTREERWNQRCAKRHPCANIHHIYHEGNYKHDAHLNVTVREQDELIWKLRYKLLHKSNCLVEEKKLIRRIEEAEEIKQTLVANPKPEIHSRIYIRETNPSQVYRAKLLKKKYEKKVLEDLEYKQKKQRSLEEIRFRMNEKRSRVHKTIYDIVKQLDQETEPLHAENTFTANIK